MVSISSQIRKTFFFNVTVVEVGKPGKMGCFLSKNIACRSLPKKHEQLKKSKEPCVAGVVGPVLIKADRCGHVVEVKQHGHNTEKELSPRSISTGEAGVKPSSPIL